MVRGFLLSFVLLVLGVFVLACAPAEDRTQQAEVHYTLGVAYMREPNLSAALREFLKAADLDARDPRIQQSLAQTYHLLRAFPEAERHYLEAIRLAPRESLYQHNLGALYLDMQRWDEAIVRFRSAAQDLLFDQPAVALTGMGMAYYQKGDYLQAVSAYESALQRNRRYAPARLHLGEAYLALNKPDLALEEFREAVRIDPAYAQAHYQLGLAYMKKSDSGQAVAAFRQVVDLSPDSDLGRRAQGYLRLLH
ncbi:tetratricopeptide repeat protein [Geoalkalibacter halelectricus]|uniref:Tetratricopeptide repeat protein n=1 Tax=Geoalkalibacter halelectricus TaxID=2847045 RepID=A0ABY5ZR15_9BACT|nr:tetratricopeptide repeat protein [Geoalkalibacter halelectricus]MDO3379297.1 tetratricopeptide repeat protein [Geoalkalibacter halelectricus]UWZ81053.1 tetratricopeptide repeat protein [Geoalkalibacter halelectricus]